MDKWINRDRKRVKKLAARKLDNQYKEKSQGKDSNQKKREAQFRKSLSDFSDELMDMFNN